jgi:hypothetical protein
MFAFKYSEVILTIAEPRFCIRSGQDGLALTEGHIYDQYGKCSRNQKALKIYTSTLSKNISWISIVFLLSTNTNFRAILNPTNFELRISWISISLSEPHFTCKFALTGSRDQIL